MPAQPPPRRKPPRSTRTDMRGLLDIPEGLSIALHTCLWIADGEGAFHPSRIIAKTLGFSYDHFAKVVQKLVRAGVLETERGPKGGIRLARNPKSLTLLDVYEAAGGLPLRPHRCMLDPKICAGRACAFGRLVEKENNLLHRKMKNTTLASLARSLDKSKLVTA